MPNKDKAKKEPVVPTIKKTKKPKKEKKYDKNPIMDVFVDLCKKTVNISSKPSDEQKQRQ